MMRGLPGGEGGILRELIYLLLGAEQRVEAPADCAFDRDRADAGDDGFARYGAGPFLIDALS